MRCEQVTPYLPGYAGGELRQDTHDVVARHVATCASCAADATQLARARAALSTLATKEIEPPAYLVDAIIGSVGATKHRALPIPPIAIADLVASVADHREAIASAAGTALVAFGAAYAVWRAVRSRGTQQPATS
jgi:anti-sigma factor RsiW